MAAEIVAVPCVRDVTIPTVSTVATPFADELQVAAAVKFFVLPSLYVAWAWNCWVNPATTEALSGETERAVSVTCGVVVDIGVVGDVGAEVFVVVPPPPPQARLIPVSINRRRKADQRYGRVSRFIAGP